MNVLEGPASLLEMVNCRLHEFHLNFFFKLQKKAINIGLPQDSRPPLLPPSHACDLCLSLPGGE